MCHHIGRAQATQEETLNLPGDNDLFPKVCMKCRQPLRRSRCSRAVDSQPERGGGDGGKLGQEKRREINTHCLAAGGKQKPIKKKKNNKQRWGVGGVVYQKLTD